MIWVAASIGVIVGMWIGWWTAKAQHTDRDRARWALATGRLNRFGHLTVSDVIEIWGKP